MARPLTLLVAEDDPDDRLLVEEAMDEAGFASPVTWVEDGAQLLEYIAAAPDQHPLPALVVVDLNMPRMDGREALAKMKADPRIRSIPIVVLTTSRDPEDVRLAYQLGVNSYIAKPSEFRELVRVMRSLSRFWLEAACLPGR